MYSIKCGFLFNVKYDNVRCDCETVLTARIIIMPFGYYNVLIVEVAFDNCLFLVTEMVLFVYEFLYVNYKVNYLIKQKILFAGRCLGLLVLNVLRLAHNEFGFLIFFHDFSFSRIYTFIHFIYAIYFRLISK